MPIYFEIAPHSLQCRLGVGFPNHPRLRLLFLRLNSGSLVLDPAMKCLSAPLGRSHQHSPSTPPNASHDLRPRACILSPHTPHRSCSGVPWLGLRWLDRLGRVMLGARILADTSGEGKVCVRQPVSQRAQRETLYVLLLPFHRLPREYCPCSVKPLLGPVYPVLESGAAGDGIGEPHVMCRSRKSTFWLVATGMRDRLSGGRILCRK